jgi:uncharacterized protein
MDAIKSLVTKRPFIFALLASFTFILMVLVSSVVANAAGDAETHKWYLSNTIGRLASIFILLLPLWRLGWLSSCGFTRVGKGRTWLMLIFPLAYSIAASALAMTGRLAFSFSDPALTGLAAIFILTHAFLEEVAFRGWIMQSFARAWSSTKHGLIKSVLVSSFYFGAMHIIYLAGEPLPVVLLRIVASFLLGIIFAALVWSGESIYPAAFFHGLLNLIGYLNLVGRDIQPGPSSWLLLSLSIIPIAVFYLYLLSNLVRKSAPEQPAFRHESPLA